jgi:hypothetical protein
LIVRFQNAEKDTEQFNGREAETATLLFGYGSKNQEIIKLLEAAGAK